MIKSILLPLDPSPYTQKATELACRLAQAHDAQITGLVILDIPGIEKSVGPVPVGGTYYAEHLEETYKKKAEDRISKLIDTFKKTCMEKGVRHKEATNQGSPSKRIIQESMFYDLIITGLRTYYQFTKDDSPGDSLQEILDSSITPVFGVSVNATVPDISSGKLNVVVPFDGSHPSARTMQRFAYLLRPDVAEIKIVMSDDDQEKAALMLKRVEEYFQAHGMKNVSSEWVTHDIKKHIEKNYLDWADVFVVGAHSKHGIFDFIVGSLTEKLIKLDKKHVFIGQ